MGIKSLSLLLLLAGFGAFAETRPQFHMKKDAVLDLIRESESVSVIQEHSIQVEPAKNLRQFKIGVGYWQSGFVEMLRGSQYATRYELSESSITPSFGFRRLLSGGRHDFGIELGVGYSVLDGHSGLIKTRLHIIPIYAGAVYRWQATPKGAWSVFSGLGPLSILTAQWGPSSYTTTDSEWAARASAGAELNLNAVFGWDRFVEYSLGLEGQFVFAQTDAESDWNGRTITATLGVLL